MPSMRPIPMIVHRHYRMAARCDRIVLRAARAFGAMLSKSIPEWLFGAETPSLGET